MGFGFLSLPLNWGIKVLVQVLQNFKCIDYKVLILVSALTACAFHISESEILVSLVFGVRTAESAQGPCTQTVTGSDHTKAHIFPFPPRL